MRLGRERIDHENRFDDAVGAQRSNRGQRSRIFRFWKRDAT
jgi:hypothetical protein